jgi:hypothetical protein
VKDGGIRAPLLMLCFEMLQVQHTLCYENIKFLVQWKLEIQLRKRRDGEGEGEDERQRENRNISSDARLTFSSEQKHIIIYELIYV